MNWAIEEPVPVPESEPALDPGTSVLSGCVPVALVKSEASSRTEI